MLSIPREYFLVKTFLSDLEQYYPGFESWYVNKVCPDIITNQRKILIRKLNGEIIAVAILKRSAEEKKICTFRVAESARRKGVGTELMRESLYWLQSNNPLITVNEENTPEFADFLSKFNFHKTGIFNGLYRPDKKEFIYNQTRGRITS